MLPVHKSCMDNRCVRLSANQPTVLFSHTKSAPAIQQYCYLITNQHQPSAIAKRTLRIYSYSKYLLPTNTIVICIEVVAIVVTINNLLKSKMPWRSLNLFQVHGLF